MTTSMSMNYRLGIDWTFLDIFWTFLDIGHFFKYKCLMLNVHLGQEGWHGYRPMLLHIFNIEKGDQQKVLLLS